ncbi:Aspartic proteinase-like protein 1 [Nymphaea thermarum]|nr:Aspartic proteinase-like protein 1 [Nymphaea thermarum]
MAELRHRRAPWQVWRSTAGMRKFYRRRRGGRDEEFDDDDEDEDEGNDGDLEVQSMSDKIDRKQKKQDKLLALLQSGMILHLLLLFFFYKISSSPPDSSRPAMALSGVSILSSTLLFFLALLFLSHPSVSKTTFSFELHHKFSDRVCEWVRSTFGVSVDNWPQPGSPEYYNALFHHDRLLLGRNLAASSKPLVTFVDGNLTLHLQLGLCGQIQTSEFRLPALTGLFGFGLGKQSVPSILAKSGLIVNSFSMCFGSDGFGRINFGDKGTSDQEETPFVCGSVTCWQLDVGIASSTFFGMLFVSIVSASELPHM